MTLQARALSSWVGQEPEVRFRDISSDAQRASVLVAPATSDPQIVLEHGGRPAFSLVDGGFQDR